MRPLLLDANNLVMRNVMASALEDLQAGGLFTGGIYGSLRSLRALVSQPEFLADRVVAIFDHGVPARRLRLLPGYKSARKERRELLTEEERERAFEQVRQCYDLFGLLGVRCLAFKSREADDGVAAAVRLYAALGCVPVVISSDADLLQTVGMGAHVWNPVHAQLVDSHNFNEVTGISLAFYVLYRALVGDTSDSIKGAHGCGPKRAVELLTALMAAEIDCLPPSLADLTPLEQLKVCADYLRNASKSRELRAWERGILTDLPRLQNVICGIDLRDSFGPVSVLEATIHASPPLREMEFLRMCRKLGMNSVLGQPESYLRPFRDLQKRRAKSDAVGV